MQILLFTLVAIALYYLADHALGAIERMHGSPLPYRNLIYFAIILSLALLTFQLLQLLASSETVL